MQHMSVVDWAIHFCWEELPGSNVLQCVDHNRREDVSREHAGFTNFDSNIPRLILREIL